MNEKTLNTEKPIANGTFVYKVIENWEAPYNYNTPYLLEGIIINSYEYRDTYAYDIKWISGAPANIVDGYGTEEEVTNEYYTRFFVNPEAAIEDYILFTSENARKKLSMLKEAKAEGKLVTFPKEEVKE